jgi:hypothetical protein
MRPIPESLKRQLAADPYYKKCARADSFCRGRITWDHAFIYAGQQINEAWAILPVCIFHHLDTGFDRNENQRIALSRATPEELAKYDRINWLKLKQKLQYVSDTTLV